MLTGGEINEGMNLLTEFLRPLQSLFQRTPISVALCSALQDLSTNTQTKRQNKMHTISSEAGTHDEKIRHSHEDDGLLF